MKDRLTLAQRLSQLPLPTLGGKQLWGDVFVYGGHRIQRNVITQHHRLLAPGDIRLAIGTWESCYQAFQRHRDTGRIQLKSDHLVLLLHGFFRSKDSFGPMTRALQRAGYAAHGVNYPSTRQGLDDHAEQVSLLLERSEGYKTVSFVTHSMGGIVARVLLSRDAPWRERIQVNRLVMIGTPNRGAQLLTHLSQLPAFEEVGGPALAALEPTRAADLPLPRAKFGVIAGARGDGRGYNPLLEGDDDMTVSVASTRLPGAEDMLIVNAVHTFIMVNPTVIRSTLRYLETGAFRG